MNRSTRYLGTAVFVAALAGVRVEGRNGDLSTQNDPLGQAIHTLKIATRAVDDQATAATCRTFFAAAQEADTQFNAKYALNDGQPEAEKARAVESLEQIEESVQARSVQADRACMVQGFVLANQ